MRIVESFPRPVRVVENLWIPMRDGARLAARLWLPADAEERPVPALLEYIPYRKRDGTRERDEPIHHYFAGHGYASLRIDLRGAGDSDGILHDEYLPQEQDDGVDAIAWVASQPWCTGAVGMLGKSWGGFNALQIAARRPPALRAVVSVCSTDDRYADDAHYMGGCLLNENLVWGTLLMGLGAQPPDPELVGARWRADWEARLAAVPLHPATWMEHPRRDDYWKHGSICEDFDAVGCPVLAVGGWADAYTNAVPRLLAGLSVPRHGLIGPWGHVYPHAGTPGPAIGFLQEALGWWDRWLRDDATTDDLGDPLLRAWMPAPGADADEADGRWVAEDTPFPTTTPHVLDLRVDGGRGLLVEHADGAGAAATPPADSRTQTSAHVPSEALSHRSPQTTGLAAGAWCRFGHDDDAPAEQSADDAGSLCFDGAPLAEGFEMLGAPRVVLRLAVDRPAAFVAVRLCDVAPDGTSRRVTYGLLDLAAREGLDRDVPVVPGVPMTVEVALNDAAHAFPPGHRLRVSVSTTYWPLVWPSPEPVTLTILGTGSRLELPVRAPRAADDALRPFGRPEGASPPEQTELRDPGSGRSVTRDDATGETRYVVRTARDEQGRVARWREDDIGLQVGQGILETFTIRDDDPLSARAEVEQVSELHRGDWRVRVVVRTRLTADRDAFRLEASLDARLGDERVAAREWDVRIPRCSSPAHPPSG